MLDNPTIEIRTGESLDWQSLDHCLKSNITDLSGELSARQYASGNSNLTYELRYGDRFFVLRRPPFGTRPKSGHSMIREYTVMSALYKGGVKVPRMIFYSDDEAIIGSEFYVMERVEGAIVQKKFPSEWELESAEKRRLTFTVFDELIKLHSLDYKSLGLTDFGRPDGYVERQISGWNKRFNNAHTADVDRFQDVQQWLEDNVPPVSNGNCVVHGDFRLDNVILSPCAPHDVQAIIDWEISALGDPLMDLGNTLAYWTEPDDPHVLKAMALNPSLDEGMPSRHELLAYYEDKTGISTANFNFYLVYGFWRNLVILQQIYYRHYHKQTQDARFASFGVVAQEMGQHCRKLIKQY